MTSTKNNHTVEYSSISRLTRFRFIFSKHQMNNISRLQFDRLHVQQTSKVARDEHELTDRIILVDFLDPIEQRAIGTSITKIDAAVLEL